MFHGLVVVIHIININVLTDAIPYSHGNIGGTNGHAKIEKTPLSAELVVKLRLKVKGAGSLVKGL